MFLRVKPLQRESEKTIEERLSEFGFSDEMVDRFFRPFFGWHFLQSRVDDRFEIIRFCHAVVGSGENCLPAKGIGAMAEQLVGKLDENSVHKNAKVEEIKNVEDGAVEVRVNMVNKEGQKRQQLREVKKCILAVEGPECDRLLGTKDKQREKGVGTTCVYFSCDKPYDAKNPMLYLDGEKYKGSSTTVASHLLSLQRTRQTGSTCVLPPLLVFQANFRTNKSENESNRNSPNGSANPLRVRLSC